MIQYSEFIKNKVKMHEGTGFEVDDHDLPEWLAPFQKRLTSIQLALGSGGTWAATGLGKTRIELAVGNEIARKSDKPYLILAPLAVAAQTVREAKRVGLENVRRIEDKSDVLPSDLICVTNYDRLERMDLSAFSGVSLDESAILRNYTGKTKQQLVSGFAGYNYRHAATATPAPNDHMELGNHSEFLGVMPSTEMLMRWFINDAAHVGHYRLKGHAEEDFWQWIASWAVCIEKPSDLDPSFSDEGYILPPLNMLRHIVEGAIPDDALFADAALSATSMHKEMRKTAKDRAQSVADLIAEDPDEQWLIWCNTNYESDELRRVLPTALEVSGSMTSDKDRKERERILEAFGEGEIGQLITKPSIAGAGMNFQSCSHMAFVGLNYSFDAMYQAIRRCWRYGQRKPVNAHVVTAESEWSLLESIERKQESHERMVRNMIDQIGNARGGRFMRDVDTIDEASGKNWKLYLGDSVESVKNIEDDSVGLTVFSPPFSNLYTYSDSLRDMGNCADHEEFFRHFQFLAPELLRVTEPGRICAIHCKDLPTYRGRDGASGLYDFPGDLIRCMESAGWSFHSRVTVWKCPVTERERTNNNGLLHKTVKRDSSQIRQGMADYVIAFRKTPPDDNLAENPIVRPNGFDEFIGDEELDPRTYHQHPSPYARLGGKDSALAIWRRYAEPVWWDISQTDVLNVKMARSDRDERHICPLQLGLIRRCIQLWSNAGDTVYSPFTGVGSEGVVSIQEGRAFVGGELKREYFNVSINNLNDAAEIGRGQIGFDFEAAGLQ